MVPFFLITVLFACVAYTQSLNTSPQLSSLSTWSAHLPTPQQLAIQIQTPQFGCSIPAFTKVVQLTITNLLDIPILVSWVNFSCYEIAYQVIDANGISSQQSFLNHVWIARTSTNDDNLGNIVSVFNVKQETDLSWNITKTVSNIPETGTVATRSFSSVISPSHTLVKQKDPSPTASTSPSVASFGSASTHDRSGEMIALVASLVAIAVMIALGIILYMRGRWKPAQDDASGKPFDGSKQSPAMFQTLMPFMAFQSKKSQRTSSLAVHAPLTGEHHSEMHGMTNRRPSRSSIVPGQYRISGIIPDTSLSSTSFLSVVLAASENVVNQDPVTTESPKETTLPSYGDFDHPVVGIPPMPNSVHLVLHPHIPREPDELNIMPGDRLLVQELYSDGWSLVCNTDGLEGVVPCYCFQP
ncbi:hypothetical protein BDV3_001204 [Batrachochytrium dendrobatidis]|uniref:SH3 domain-containing protein n=1 Tax=Batrachochytrium dendrobatidis (strain JEL423) TaxID=403673 RepID=A0A177W6Z6_BATDL|nr:hypothetical protein BDEG_20081 [Batrachochytrium dendrobatidis JEL423]